MFHQVLVAGIGALGSEVVENLGLLGCDSVFLADADILAAKNIERSVLLREGGMVGHSKVSCALGRLRIWFPKTRWDGAAVEIADVEPEHFLKSEILFSCVDTDLAHTEITALAARYKLPVCDAGLGGTSTRVGRVSWFPGDHSTACFACLFSTGRRAALFSKWESDVRACWARDPSEENTWTSTPTMASIVAGLQVEIAISSAKSAGEAFSVHVDLDRSPVSQTIQHRRGAECASHADLPGDPFPVCTRAECGTCGREFSPGRRIAWMRRWWACPTCGSRDPLIRDSVRGEQAGRLS